MVMPYPDSDRRIQPIPPEDRLSDLEDRNTVSPSLQVPLETKHRGEPLNLCRHLEDAKAHYAQEPFLYQNPGIADQDGNCRLCVKR